MIEGLFTELRTTLREIRGGGLDWRKLGLRALPVAAAATAGAGGLCARKILDPPSPDLLAEQATFQCRAQDPASSARLRRQLEAAGADVPALRRVAQRLRGPVERDIMQVEHRRLQGEGAEGLAQLVQEWKAAGYHSEPLTRARPRLAQQGVDPVTQVDESYGRDVGCEVPLCLLREGQEGEEFRTLSPADSACAAQALRAHGAVLLRGLLPPSQVQALRCSLGIQSSALDRGKSSAAGAPVREYDASVLHRQDPDLEPVVSTPGRRHFYLRNRPLEEVVRGAQAGALPLIWEHLLWGGGERGGLPYVSELQLLVTDPCAADQFWHIDNSAPGVSLVVPLTPVTVETGATQVCPGSHHLFPFSSSGMGSFVSSFLSADGAPVGRLEAGDAFLYDSRLMHRGFSNRRYDRTAVALVFRYDFERPPGLGMASTQLLSWAGNILHVLQRFYAVLPGSRPAATGPAVQAEGRKVGAGAAA